MARGSDRLEQDFIATAQAKTGHDVAGWIEIIRAEGIEEKPNAILKWLKEAHGMNHLQANLMAGLYLNGGQPVYDYPVMWQKLFAGKETLWAWYKEIEGRVLAALDDVEFIPTKAYASVEGKKIFACVTPTKSTLRVGLDLGNHPFDEVIQKAKGLGAMPNLTHMIEIESPADINDSLVDHFRQAYQKVHG
jgi:hypothetical protein